MAFIFVAETGDADPDSNSFTTVEYADDYISTNSFVAADWLALEEEDKQKLLVRASKYINSYVLWHGKRVDPESGLRWPRTGVYDPDGFEIPEDQIPAQLQDAVCEFAAQLISDDWTQAQGTKGIKEIQVDVIDLKFDTNMVRASLPDFVMKLLADFGSVVRGNRPAFKKINRK